MNIWWDYKNRALLKSLSSQQQYGRIDWVLRDYETVRLYLVTLDDTTGEYTVAPAPSGLAIKCSIKKTGERDQDPLASQYVWAQSGTGEDAYYEATVNLNTTALITEVEGEADYELDLMVEFTLQDANEKNKYSTQWQLRVAEDLHRPTDSAATAAERIWPWFEFYQDEEGGPYGFRIKDPDGVTKIHVRPDEGP